MTDQRRVVVDELAVQRAHGRWQLSARVQGLSRRPARLRFRVAGAEPQWLAQSGNPFVPALVLPAMARQAPLEVRAPVSARLLSGSQSAMELYRSWWQVDPQAITAARAAPATTGRGVGLFFTAGVDSFASLLDDIAGDHPGRPATTHLVHCDFGLDAGLAHRRLLGQLAGVAQEVGRRLVVVETNVRTLTQGVVGWEEHHGAALAAVALALEGLLGTCFVAASDHIGHLPPWGSHPLLDPLWSTEGLRIVHDGIDSDRAEKVAEHIARSPLALSVLSVCWQDRPGRNCGRCAKCVGTMIMLELAGALDRCDTLPALDLAVVRQLRFVNQTQRDDTRILRDRAKRAGRSEIAEALEVALLREDAQADGTRGRWVRRRRAAMAAGRRGVAEGLRILSLR